MKIEAYLFFAGTCEEAFDAYAAILGGTVWKMRYGENPDEPCDPAMANQILHATLTAGGAQLMGSDSPPGMLRPAGGFATSIAVDDVAEGERIFRALAEGGSVQMAWGETFWARGFGMLTDRFGMPWMVNVAKPM